MKRMPNIDLTDEHYEIIVYAGQIAHGGEAVVCRGQRPDTLYKMFTQPHSKKPTPMLDNKYHKIMAQYENPLEHSVQPLSTISLNGELIGYEVTYDIDDTILGDLSLSRPDLIHYLKQMRNILEYYESRDITYGDIKSDNILVNTRTKKIKFCDMDNIRMGEHQIDLLGYDLACFFNEHGSLDDTTHAYMHNLLTLEQLNYPMTTYQDIIYGLSANHYPKGFKRCARPIMDSIARAENFEGEYLIDYVKRKK